MAVVLRATAKVLRSLVVTATDEDESDTALGDWYVNRVVVARQPLLLLVSARSFLPIVAPARDVRNLPSRLARMVADRLTRLGICERLIRAEVIAMEGVRIARTRDRSVIGQMVDFAKSMPYYLPQDGSDLDVRFMEDQLIQTPCRSGRGDTGTIFPDRDTAGLLKERWRT